MPFDVWTLVVMSGIVGIFLGDRALFLTLNRLGPRATGVLFAANAPITVLLGWLVLGEALSLLPLLGTIVAFGGIVLAIFFGRQSAESGSAFEKVNGPLWIGVCFGLFAATCQAGGALLLRPVMIGDGGVTPDPIAISAVRVGIAALALHAVTLLPIEAMRPSSPLTLRLFGLTALSGLLAMGIGMTLLVFALSGGEAGIIATLSATTPVMILPFLWYLTGQMPRIGSWFGAGLTVAGIPEMLLPPGSGASPYPDLVTKAICPEMFQVS
ncbi:MAG: DMT family transporter [Aliishimia sp.]